MLDAPPATHAASTDHPGLTITVQPDATPTTIGLSGDLDLETAAQLRREIDALRGAGSDDIAVDLAGVTFVDSTGLRTLLAYARAASSGELRFRLSRPSARVRRLIELTATQDVFEYVERSAA